MRARFALFLVCLQLLTGCAGLGIEVGNITDRAVSYYGKYCKFMPNVRFAARNNINELLSTKYGDEAWVMVHCPTDPPTSWRP